MVLELWVDLVFLPQPLTANKVVLLRELVETVGHMQPMVVDPVRAWVRV